MEKEIRVYVYLLNEGVDTWRPVPAIHKKADIYILQGFDFHNPDDEEWEFLPGTAVHVEEKMLSGDGRDYEKKLVAVRECQEDCP